MTIERKVALPSPSYPLLARCSLLATRYSLLLLLSLLLAGCSPEAKIERHLGRGKEYFDKGEFEKAEIEYINVLRIQQRHPMAIRQLGLMAHQQGRVGRAYHMLEQSTQNAPDDIEVKLAFAQSVLAGGAVQKARALAAELVAQDPTNGTALRLLVESSATAAELMDAAQLLERHRRVAEKTAGFHIAMGLIQARARDLDLAEASLRRATELEPNSSSAHVALGRLLFARNQRAAAEAEFKQAAELAPPRSIERLQFADYKLGNGDIATARAAYEAMAKETPDFLPVQLRLAQIAFLENRHADSEKIVLGILARDHFHLEGMLLLARIASARDENAKATSILERALGEYPRVAVLHYELALARFAQTGSVSETINSLNQALVLQPDYPDAALFLAEMQLRRGDAHSAITLLTGVVKKHSDIPASHLLLANAYYANGDPDGALKVYEALARQNPNNPQIPLRAGLLLRQAGRAELAREFFEVARKIDPGYFRALDELVSLDLAEQKIDAAKARVDEVIAKNPQSAPMQVLLARVQLAGRNYPAAETALKKAIELDGNTTEAHTLLARTYVAANRHTDALQKLAEIVGRDPADIGSWLQIARLKSAAEDYAGAKVAYESILKVNPEFAPALNNLSWILLEHLGQPEKALEIARKARVHHPRDPAIADSLGWALFRAGDYQRAVVLLRESLSSLPDNPDVNYHLAMAHYMLGEEIAARTAFQAALQREPRPWKADAERKLRILAIDPRTARAADLEALEKGDQFSPDPVLMARIGAVAEREGRWDEAVRAYEKSVAANANYLPAVTRLISLYASRDEKPARASELARRAWTLDQGNAAAAHVLGLDALQKATTVADFQRAYNLLQESALKLPNEAFVQHDFAWASATSGKLQEAVPVMQKAIRGKLSEARERSARRMLALAPLVIDPAAAEGKDDVVEQALDEEPKHPLARMARGLAQERRGEFAAAARTFEDILTQYPLFAPARRSLAILYSGPIRDETKAFQHATRAREALPDDPVVAKVLGMLEYDRDQFQRAAQLLSESAQKRPRDPDVLYRLGIARHRLKQLNESAEVLRTALEIAPTSPLATHAKLILAEMK